MPYVPPSTLAPCASVAAHRASSTACPSPSSRTSASPAPGLSEHSSSSGTAGATPDVQPDDMAVDAAADTVDAAETPEHDRSDSVDTLATSLTSLSTGTDAPALSDCATNSSQSVRTLASGRDDDDEHDVDIDADIEAQQQALAQLELDPDADAEAMHDARHAAVGDDDPTLDPDFDHVHSHPIMPHDPEYNDKFRAYSRGVYEFTRKLYEDAERRKLARDSRIKYHWATA